MAFLSCAQNDCNLWCHTFSIFLQICSQNMSFVVLETCETVSGHASDVSAAGGTRVSSGPAHDRVLPQVRLVHVRGGDHVRRPQRRIHQRLGVPHDILAPGEDFLEAASSQNRRHGTDQRIALSQRAAQQRIQSLFCSLEHSNFAECSHLVTFCGLAGFHNSQRGEWGADSCAEGRRVGHPVVRLRVDVDGAVAASSQRVPRDAGHLARRNHIRCHCAWRHFLRRKQQTNFN